MTGSPLRSMAGLSAAVFVAVFFVYGRSVGFPFQFDDGHSILANPYLASLANIPRLFVDPGTFSVDPTLRMYRPVLLTGLVANHWLSGTAPWSYHLANVLVHGLVVVLVFQVATRLLGDRRRAVLAAGLFALHPVHSEAVYYVSSRSVSQAALFALFALWLHLRPPSMGNAVAEVVAFAAALLTKSVAMALIPVLVLHDTLFRTGAWKTRTRQYAGLGTVALGYLLMSRQLVARAVVEAPVRGYDEQLWSQVKAFIYYAKLMFVPRGLSVDHQFQLSSSIVDPYAASALALLASISVIVWRLGRRWPEAPFYALWALVGLLPASLIPLNVIVNEHRLYLAGVAFAIACACLTGRSQTRPAVGRGMGTAIVLLAVLAFQRGDAWASTESLWEDAASKGPAMARPWFLLGTEYLHQGRIGEGMAAVERAVERDPNLLAAHVTLAETARQQAFVADADRSWWERSARAYERAIELAPDDLSLRGNLGNTYQELGRADLALPHHRRATAMDPANPETRLNLGNTYLMLDRLKEAEVEYGAVLELAPEYSEAWRNLSVLYTRSGRAQDAAQAAAAAARIETHR